MRSRKTQSATGAIGRSDDEQNFDYDYDYDCDYEGTSTCVTRLIFRPISRPEYGILT
jgi:hypothetical protein